MCTDMYACVYAHARTRMHVTSSPLPLCMPGMYGYKHVYMHACKYVCSCSKYNTFARIHSLLTTMCKQNPLTKADKAPCTFT